MKNVRSRRRKIRNKKTSKNALLLLAIGLLITISYFFANSKIMRFTHSVRFEDKLISGKSLGNIRLTPPLSTPTPTEIPTPTPFPLIGYCLNVPVVMYHHIQPNAEAQSNGQQALSMDSGEFDNQMAYLNAQGYTAISAQQLIDALLGHLGVPQKSIVITMDDGYKDIYSYAYPILQKYHIVANIGVITGLVGGADYLSWGQIEEMSHSGLVNMMNHTWSHYNIAQNSTDKVKFEIATARQQLQDHTGQNVATFVYPYGMFNSNAISILNEEGVQGAFSEIPGHWQCDSFVMTLHRTRIGNASLAYYGF